MKTFNMFMWEKFSPVQISKLKTAYGKLNKVDPTGPAYKKGKEMISKLDKNDLMSLAKAKIKFLSQMAASELSRSHNVKLKAKEYMESDMKEYGSYPTGGASTGPGMGQYRPVADLNASTDAYRKSLEQIAKDRQMKSLSKKDRDTLMKISKMLAKEKK